MSSGTESDIAALRSELAQLRTDFAKVAGTLQDLTRHGKAEAAAKTHDSAQHLREAVTRQSQNIAQIIEEQPITSALTTFAVGMVLGSLVGGRRS